MVTTSLGAFGVLKQSASAKTLQFGFFNKKPIVPYTIQLDEKAREAYEQRVAVEKKQHHKKHIRHQIVGVFASLAFAALGATSLMHEEGHSHASDSVQTEHSSHTDKHAEHAHAHEKAETKANDGNPFEQATSWIGKHLTLEDLSLATLALHGASHFAISVFMITLVLRDYVREKKKGKTEKITDHLEVANEILAENNKPYRIVEITEQRKKLPVSQLSKADLAELDEQIGSLFKLQARLKDEDNAMKGVLVTPLEKQRKKRIVIRNEQECFDKMAKQLERFLFALNLQIVPVEPKKA